jgi:hypothetical protein
MPGTGKPRSGRQIVLSGKGCAYFCEHSAADILSWEEKDLRVRHSIFTDFLPLTHELLATVLCRKGMVDEASAERTWDNITVFSRGCRANS